MMTKRFATIATTLLLVCCLPALWADDRGRLIFEDNFDRTESTESKEEIGNGWATNSKSRAAGNKQVDLRDGVMFITMHEAADHAVSFTHPAEFTDGTVELRFMLENSKDTLGLDFADLQWKTVHAGHLFKVTVTGDSIAVSLDGNEALSFSSAGFANPTKRMLRLSVPKQAVVDDVKIYSRNSSVSTK